MREARVQIEVVREAFDELEQSGRLDGQALRRDVRIDGDHRLACGCVVGELEENGLGRVGRVEHVAVGRNGQRVQLVLLLVHDLQQAVDLELVLRIAQHRHPLILLAQRVGHEHNDELILIADATTATAVATLMLLFAAAAMAAICRILTVVDAHFEGELVVAISQQAFVERDAHLEFASFCCFASRLGGD